jgi:hypothetical protein
MCDMPLIVFFSNELQPLCTADWIPGAICIDGRSVKTPGKISPRDSELENLLRSAVRLLKAQNRAVQTTAAGTKGNRKV